MIHPMKKRLLASLLALSFAVAVPAHTYASDEEDDGVDARLKGYKDGSLALKDAGGTATSWILLVVLCGMSLGVLFINAKRTHLD